MKEINFYDFMQEKYSGKDTPAGDLANDMKNDPKIFDLCKMFCSKQEIALYLKEKGACTEALQTFNKCWSYFLKLKRQNKAN